MLMGWNTIGETLSGGNRNSVGLYLYGLIVTASHRDMQKIRIIGFFLIGYMGRLQFCCYYLQYVPASKPFDHVCFEVL
jgi:hypothetical protein